jgi:hypothetical protein
MLPTPNIFIFYQNEEYIFYNQQWLNEKNISDVTRNFIVKKLNLNYDEALLVLTSGYVDTNINQIVNFIQNEKIKKIYFFIEDTLRLYANYENYTGDNHLIYQDPKNVKAYELDIITEIIKNTQIEYKIFHCEENTNFFERMYNVKIQYFDWFVADQGQYDFSNPYSILSYVIPENERKSYFSFQEKFDYKICNLNLRDTMPRLYIASLLCQHNHAFVTWHGDYHKNVSKNLFRFSLNKFSSAIQNEITSGIELLESKRRFRIHENKDSKELGQIEGTFQYSTASEIRNSFVQIVSESKFVSPMPNFSEKTLKSIMCFRPFILLAPPSTLKLLKDLGFKTFDRWWDESYDNIENHHERLETVYSIAKYILSKNKEELSHLLIEMKHILEYNRAKLFVIKETMWKYYLERDLQKL